MDEESLKELLRLGSGSGRKEMDLVVCNYVYDHLYENKTKPMRLYQCISEEALYLE